MTLRIREEVELTPEGKERFFNWVHYTKIVLSTIDYSPEGNVRNYYCHFFSERWGEETFRVSPYEICSKKPFSRIKNILNSL